MSGAAGTGDAGGSSAQSTGKVQFTPEQQAAINDIVSKRVNETKQAMAQEFEPFRTKAQQLDLMLADTDVQQFLMDKASGRQRGQGKPTQTQGDDEYPEVEEIRRIDPDLAPHILKLADKLATKKAEAAVSPIREELTKIRLDGSQRELDGMLSDAERWPYLQSKEFQGAAARYLNEGRAMSLPDAYNLARIQYMDEGKLDTLPKRPSEVAEEKKQAELLESGSGTGGTGAGGGEPPPKFNNPREAAEWSMKKLGFA